MNACFSFTSISVLHLTGTNEEGKNHQLVAVDSRDYSGYLAADLNSVVCNQLQDLHVLSVQAEIDPVSRREEGKHLVVRCTLQDNC